MKGNAHMLSSTVCRYEHFESDWYARWAGEIGYQIPVTEEDKYSYRKIWEWAAVAETLSARGMLEPGRKGLGFAVGQEWLPGLFARRGVEVLATDLPIELSDGRWSETGQHAETLEALFHPQHIDREAFERLVSFQPVDMNDLSALPNEGFDFLWSSCAFEHLGTLDAGLSFVESAMRLLKPGGIAVHTTEYNVSSNDGTITEGPNCIYRRRDLEDLDRRLRLIGAGIEAMDFDAGTHEYDLNYDVPPYFVPGRKHIKLAMDGHVCTSFLLVIRRG